MLTVLLDATHPAQMIVIAHQVAPRVSQFLDIQLRHLTCHTHILICKFNLSGECRSGRKHRNQCQDHTSCHQLFWSNWRDILKTIYQISMSIYIRNKRCFFKTESYLSISHNRCLHRSTVCVAWLSITSTSLMLVAD